MNNSPPLHKVVLGINNLSNKILYLAQSSLTEFQFKAFRKLTLDYFAELIKSLGTDRCGRKQNDDEGGGVMSG